jgi:hypothetical protein
MIRSGKSIVEDTVTIALTLVGSVIAIIGTYLANAHFQRKFSLIERQWEEKYRSLQILIKNISKSRDLLLLHIQSYKVLDFDEIKKNLDEIKQKDEQQTQTDNYSKFSAFQAGKIAGIIQILFKQINIQKGKLIQLNREEYLKLPEHEKMEYLDEICSETKMLINESVIDSILEVKKSILDIQLIVEDVTITEETNSIIDSILEIEDEIVQKNGNIQMGMVKMISLKIDDVKKKSRKELNDTKRAKF